MERERGWLLNEKYHGIETDDFFADLEKLEQGTPLAYLIGYIPFLRTNIFLDSKPLIPRPETEFWTEQAIRDIKNLNITNPKILDLCAGSGCIGVAVMKEIPDAQVDFAEINSNHHKTIQKNIQANNLTGRTIHIFGGSLFDEITQKYDAILTNPPYIDPELSERVQSSVINHEPNEALFGGKKGMELIHTILQEAPKFLNPNGILYIEHEPEQESIIKEILPRIESFEDQFGIIRYSVYKN